MLTNGVLVNERPCTLWGQHEAVLRQVHILLLDVKVAALHNAQLTKHAPSSLPFLHSLALLCH